MSDSQQTIVLRGERLKIPPQYSTQDVARFLDGFCQDTNLIKCWIWHGAKSGDGYGLMSVRGKQIPAHRFSFEVYRGPIPDGFHVHHLCEVVNCVNPWHLKDVSPSSHVKDFTPNSITSINSAKQFCLRGHPLVAENLRTRHDGHRSCKVCLREDAKAKRDAEWESRDFTIKSHCKFGHEWIPDNVETDKYGRQFCKICRKKNADSWYARKKANAEPLREKRTTHCKRGHELTPDNTYKWIDKKTGKECQTCHQCKKDAMKGYKRKTA